MGKEGEKTREGKRVGKRKSKNIAQGNRKVRTVGKENYCLKMPNSETIGHN